jgi:DNA-binding transcriptional LysR family regulator
MKLRQLQCLCAIVDAGFNISRAATALHATQPAVGKQLRQLEEELGIDLLLRQRGRLVALTAAGERTIAWARRSLQCAENFRAAARETRGGHAGGDIFLVTSHTHANYMLLPAIVGFAKDFPRVHIHVQQGTPDQVARLVRDGSVTVGVSHQPPELPPEVLVIPFQASRQVLVAPVGHPLLKSKLLTLEQIAEHPIIAQNPARPQGARVLGKFVEAGLEVNRPVEALDADVMKTYVAGGLGVSIIPAFSYSAQRDRRLRIRDAGHLFDAVVSAVLLKRESHLPTYVYAFLERLDATLERRRVEGLVFGA